ncbi:MAG: C69 family dipeptidase [Lachnospiraceae bacterium]|nr:C69 family dipeptidase [Lachnospiraceae bacterium]
MPCTTILVGKYASFDGSTMMARNEDSGHGSFTPKKFIVVNPEEQPRVYRSVISKVEIELPDDPMRYTAVPDALPDRGIWGEYGVNEANVAMSETETITSNPRVLSADPLVKGGIGEEDFLTIVLPYVRSAREGVKRLGSLLEQYGTYEMNGVGFQDFDEIWWMETIGGHHWIARRVPDECYAVIPNQLGIDTLNFRDAFGAENEYMCSHDLLQFIRENHLDLRMDEDGRESDLVYETDFDVRAAFGSHADSDHSYNTPRAWIMERTLNPKTFVWDGENADYRPDSDDLPWCLVPERKVTVEDIKQVLSSHYQGTPYDPYGKYGDDSERGRFRPIAVNRTCSACITQLRPYLPESFAALQWVAMGSNVYNSFVPFYANVTVTPEYFTNTGKTPDTASFYWENRMIAALADPHFPACQSLVERYQNRVQSVSTQMIRECDCALRENLPEDLQKALEEKNQEISDFVKEETDSLLSDVLYEASMSMKNSYSRSDA